MKKDWYQEGFGKADYPEFWEMPRVKALIKVFSRLERPGKILDVGCGDGALTLKLKEACAAGEAFGIDISENAARLASERGIKAICLDIDNEEFRNEDDFFDVICVSEVFEHLFDPDRLLRNCLRTLKPGGTLVLTSPNLSCWYNRLALFLGYQPFYTGVSLTHNVGHMREHGLIGHDHLRVAAFRALKELIRAHGFHVVEAFTVPAGGEPFPVNMVSAVLRRIYPSCGMTSFIIARK